MGLLVSNVHVMLDGIMFDYLFFYPFAVTVGFLRNKVCICTHIFDDVTMYEVVKGDVF